MIADDLLKLLEAKRAELRKLQSENVEELRLRAEIKELYSKWEDTQYADEDNCGSSSSDTARWLAEFTARQAAYHKR